jgi:hypothetical protein
MAAVLAAHANSVSDMEDDLSLAIQVQLLGLIIPIVSMHSSNILVTLLW